MDTTETSPLGTAVLVHGTWGNPDDWQWVRGLLEERGVHVETPDLPSHRSSRAGLLDDAEEVRQLLRQAQAPIVAVGWSYGGEVVGVAAAGVHDVVRLVVVSTTPLPPTVQVRRASWFDEGGRIYLDKGRATFVLDSDWFLNEEKGTTFKPEVRDHLRRNPRRPASMRAYTDPVLSAAWQSIPTTVLLGRDDELVSADERRWVAETITDVREIDDDHFILFNHPEAIADIVVEALEGAGRTASLPG